MAWLVSVSVATLPHAQSSLALLNLVMENQNKYLTCPDALLSNGFFTQIIRNILRILEQTLGTNKL